MKNYPNSTFWLLYIGFNLLLFLPLYLLTAESSSFFPSLEWPLFSEENFKPALQFRNNFDIFRLNVEIPLLLTLWLLCRPLRKRTVRVVLVGLLLFVFYYYLYEAITVSFFLVDPIFYNQYLMAIDGLSFLFQHIDLPILTYIVAGILFVGGHWLIIKLLWGLLSVDRTAQLHWATRVMMVIILGLGVASVWRFRVALANPVMVASSITYKMQKNISESLKIAESIHGYTHDPIATAYDYSENTLTQKPNIYYIVIESYGSVLYKRPHFTTPYLTVLNELEQTLEQNDWYVTSNFSTAPTWGGGSWMSYASLLMGQRIETHPEFLFLRNRYQFEDYPDIGHYLKGQGYRYFRISPLSVEMTEPEWAQYMNFYGVDEWLRFRDMNYTGTRYSWGPSPPEQYTLGFMQQEMEQRAPDQPHLMFLITQNSHYPWNPLPPHLSDWQEFNGETPAKRIYPAINLRGLDAQRKNYLAAIEYELRATVNFIIEQDKNAIFVLVGDHQPPRVSRRDDGFETPMHIISGDPALLQGFTEYGFEEGLRVNNQTPPIKHEGFLSLFVRTLTEQYGLSDRALPPYLPNGVDPAPELLLP